MYITIKQYMSELSLTLSTFSRMGKLNLMFDSSLSFIYLNDWNWIMLVVYCVMLVVWLCFSTNNKAGNSGVWLIINEVE